MHACDATHAPTGQIARGPKFVQAVSGVPLLLLTLGRQCWRGGRGLVLLPPARQIAAPTHACPQLLTTLEPCVALMASTATLCTMGIWVL